MARTSISSLPALLTAPSSFLVYGTAWKKDKTATLVTQALKAGFRVIDTAAQPKHYREDLVGDAIRAVLAEGILKREDIYLHTKFTPPPGQDPHNLPYALSDALPLQINSSIASSLSNLRPTSSTSSIPTSYIDCLLLHSPLETTYLTLVAWRILESFVPSRIRTLGVANIDLATLRTLFSAASIKPALVQNRFYRSTGYDVAVRDFCRENGIVYQAFWTLTGNPQLWDSELVKEVAARVEVEEAVALYALVIGLGDLVILDGTTDAGRMVRDLEGLGKVWGFVGEKEGREVWEGWMGRFKGLLGVEM